MGVLIDHVACPDCGGSDCLAIYEEENGTFSGTCWSQCMAEDGKGYKSHNHLAKSYLGEELSITVNKGNSRQEKKPVRRKLGSKKDNKDKIITEKQINAIRENTTEEGNGFRGISDKTLKRFRVRTEWDESGEVSNRYYPVTLGKDKNNVPKLTGYHKRIVIPEKDFRAVGLNSKECELFGQWLCKGNKKLVLNGGQEDTMAAWEMFNNYREGKDNIAPVDFVSGTVGEPSLAEQIRFNYDFIDRYDEIIIDMDDDEAGERAVDALLEVLPLHKVKIMAYGAKDANQALEDKIENEYIRAIYNARKPRVSGIVSSLDLHQKIIEICDIPSIPLPPILRKANEMLGGGLPLGEIVNVLAGCVDADTEFFTGEGWKRIADYAKGDKVGQYNEDGSLSLVEPLAYIKKPCEKMNHITTTRGLDQVLSDEHRFVYWQPHKRNDPSASKEMLVKDLLLEHKSKPSGFSRGQVKTFFNYSGKGLEITEGELRLQVAVMADGRVVREGRDNYTQMRFNKKSKYNRLIWLCENFDLRYDDRGINNQGSYEVIVWPKYADKFFTAKYYECTNDQLKVILDEILYWDGYLENKSFSTTIKDSADFIQFAYAATGIRATISQDSRSEKYRNGYCATVYPTDNGFVGLSAGGGGKGAKVEKYLTTDGYKYCFNVPSGYLVLRRNGKIFVTGNSGIGKTTIVGEFTHYWIFNSPHKIGVLSYEAVAGQYGMKLLSRHLGVNLLKIVDRDEEGNVLPTKENRKRYLQREKVLDKAEELYRTEEGDERFALIDSRDEMSTAEDVKRKIIQLIKAHQVKVVIIDPITDLLDSMETNEQAAFLSWLKKMKSTGITFVLINHSRKTGSNTKSAARGGSLDEQDMMGTGAVYRSGAVNIIIERDKEAEDEIERNTTKVRITKNRDGSETGKADELYYEYRAATLHNKEDWLEENGNF